MTTPIDTKALRELLAKATPGPWTHHIEDNLIEAPSAKCLLSMSVRSISTSHAQRDIDATYVAAANPLTMAALLDTIERKDAEIASQRTQWNTLHRIIRDFEIAAARRFGATGSVYDEGRRVAYGQCCAEIRAALAPQGEQE